MIGLDASFSAFTVLGVVGVGGSPSCGVSSTLDLRRSFETVAACPLGLIDRDTVNERAVVACAVAGEGLFMRALRSKLARSGVDVPFVEYDLIAEMRGLPQPDSLRSLVHADTSLGAALATSADALAFGTTSTYQPRSSSLARALANRSARESGSSKCSSVQCAGMPACRCCGEMSAGARRSISETVSSKPARVAPTRRLSVMIVPVATRRL